MREFSLSKLMVKKAVPCSFSYDSCFWDMKRFFRAVGSLSPVSNNESSHLSSHRHVDAAGFDTAYLSTFFFVKRQKAYM